jgi:hypothetical protein
MATAAEGKLADVTTQAPVVVDMGKKSRKQIKQLREGRGKLMTEVAGVLEELRIAGTISASAQPVVIVLRQRRKSPLMWPLA